MLTSHAWFCDRNATDCFSRPVFLTLLLSRISTKRFLRFSSSKYYARKGLWTSPIYITTLFIVITRSLLGNTLLILTFWSVSRLCINTKRLIWANFLITYGIAMRLEGTMDNGSAHAGFGSAVHRNEYGKGDRTTAAPNVWVFTLYCT